MKTTNTTKGVAIAITAAPTLTTTPPKKTAADRYKVPHGHKEQGSDITHERYKNPYDNLLYCILLQAVTDKYNDTYELTKTERRTAKEFFKDGTAKVFYNYLKGAKKK